MTRTLQLTATEAAAWAQVTEGGTFLLVRRGDPPDPARYTERPQPKPEPIPPAEFVQACGPCDGERAADPEWTPCPDCRIELVGPCSQCGGDGCDWCDYNGGDFTLGFAYAVGDPLPIVLCGSGHGLVGEYVVVENARVFRIKNDEFPVESEELTDAFAHYGPPESLVGKWAMQLRRLS